MVKEETTTEKLILQAAMKEFVLKGYSGAKTTAIAQRAGVTHAMLHYYYRTKANLFKRVFQENAQVIADSMGMVLDEEAPFETVLRAFVEKHFDFAVENPGLINFVLNEIRSDRTNLQVIQGIIRSKAVGIIGCFDRMMVREVQAGRIKSIPTIEVLLNMMMLNFSTSLGLHLAEEVLSDSIPGGKVEFLNRRKEANVQYILFLLKP